LILAYVVSIFAATLTASLPLVRSYGLPLAWSPRPIALLQLAGTQSAAGRGRMRWNGVRASSICSILGLRSSPPAVVGIYYVAQQVATLPQKLKTRLEPILGPVITRNLQRAELPRNRAAGVPGGLLDHRRTGRGRAGSGHPGSGRHGSGRARASSRARRRWRCCSLPKWPPPPRW